MVATSSFTIPFFAFITAASAGSTPSSDTYLPSTDNTSAPEFNTTVTELGKNVTEFQGEGHVGAGGVLDPFGEVGMGCGVNWQSGEHFGGEMNAGSEVLGFSGGWKITPTSVEFGAGVGFNPTNSTGDITFSAFNNGTIELVFSSTADFTCVPSISDDDQTTYVCKGVVPT